MNAVAWRDFMLHLVVREPLEEDYEELENRVVRQVGMFFEPEEVVLRKPQASLYGRDIHRKLRLQDKNCPERYEDYLIREARHMLPRLIQEKHVTRLLLTLLDPQGTMMYLELAWYLTAGTRRFDREEMVRFNRALAEYFVRRAFWAQTQKEKRTIHEAASRFPLAVAVVDELKRIEYLNDAFVQKVTRDRNQLLGSYCHQVLCKQDRPEENCPLAADAHALNGLCRYADRSSFHVFPLHVGSNGDSRRKALLVETNGKLPEHGRSERSQGRAQTSAAPMGRWA